MRILVQRVKKASVAVDEQVVGSISKGLLIFLAIHKDDDLGQCRWLAKKAANLRIFPDEANKMNRSLIDCEGDALVVSQFTLYGNVKQGRRPDFLSSASGEFAEEGYKQFLQDLEEELDRPVERGIFAAKMDVSLVNDGPVTLIVDTPK